MPTNEGFSGVSNCYVFKSRLQEYAQKVGYPTPVYETTKEGPSHEPYFRSTVIINDVRYESLPGFFNRKAAEQSAAEVALLELAKTGEVNESIAVPIHETGLCKNLLQEYAQKMNYAIPIYQCQKVEVPGRVQQFSCTVEIGGIRYIGAAAKTKKEAELKAARTALLAIKSSTPESSDKSVANPQLTVIPIRKRTAETANNPEETMNVPKPKKARFKKKMFKKKRSGDNIDRSQDKDSGNPDVQAESVLNPADFSGVEAVDFVPMASVEELERELPPAKGASSPQAPSNSSNEHLTNANANESNHEASNGGKSFVVDRDLASLVKVTGISEMPSIVNDLSQIETSS
ncbi:hypothetical protein SLA2020_333540 [Shorea laevis]